jgi:hypothetical protein
MGLLGLGRHILSLSYVRNYRILLPGLGNKILSSGLHLQELRPIISLERPYILSYGYL